jgi:glycosyltransferase involved in cell wall biosynthesis
MDTPDISVILPVWGRYRAFLPSFLSNLADQRGVRVEVVVIDNGSEPPLGGVAGATVLRSARRLTLGASRNVGLAAAKAPLLCFGDVDDLIVPGTFEFLAGRMRERPELVSCGCRLAVWDPDTDERQVYYWPNERDLRLIDSPSKWAWAMTVEHRFPMACCSLHRTTAVHDAGGFPDIEPIEDWALGIRLAWRGPMEFHERVGRLYRNHESLDNDRSARAYRDDYRLVRKWVYADPKVPLRVKLARPYLAIRHAQLAKRWGQG